MQVTSLAGGVGAAKLLVGLERVLAPGRLTAVVNTADDALCYGVHVSPDVDIVTYWLAGIADVDRGWGIRGDTWHVLAGLERLGVETWFRLGDRDFATCVYRTERLQEGVTLSAATDEVRRALGVRSHLLPMSDDPVRTRLWTSDGSRLDFQQYFVREGTRPDVTRIEYWGADDAKPAPGVIDSIERADAVVVCPSNPFLSIGPILALPDVREALVGHPRVIAVSPIVRGVALKGPADRLLARLLGESSAAAVARLYRDFCDIFVADSSDREQTDRLEGTGIRTVALDTIMKDPAASERLARAIVQL